MKPGTRYAIFVLVLWSILAPGGVLLVSINQINATAHKFCQVIDAATAVKINPPADPKLQPVSERTWEWYVRYQALGNSLGCAPPVVTNP